MAHGSPALARAAPQLTHLRVKAVEARVCVRVACGVWRVCERVQSRRAAAARARARRQLPLCRGARKGGREGARRGRARERTWQGAPSGLVVPQVLGQHLLDLLNVGHGGALVHDEQGGDERAAAAAAAAAAAGAPTAGHAADLVGGLDARAAQGAVERVQLGGGNGKAHELVQRLHGHAGVTCMVCACVCMSVRGCV